MSSDLKCKDFFIFKFRYYADKRILDRHGPSHEQHWKRARESNIFFWNFFEKATNIKEGSFHENFMFCTRECAYEELIEKCGIYIFAICEGFYTYAVPWKHTELIDWINSKLTKPHQIVTRACFGYVNIKAFSTFQRDKSSERTKEFKKLLFIEESTRKILVEKTTFYKYEGSLLETKLNLDNYVD